MGFQFEKDKMYMMPVLFGPSSGPRQSKDGQRFIYSDPIRKESHIIVYESNPDQLEAILPPGFSLYSPHVIIQLDMNTNIAWLAGKEYNLLGIRIPVYYDSPEGKLNGYLMIVMWENHADPIITGREQLGYNKIFAEIKDVKRVGDFATSSLSSWGFEFLNMEIDFSEEPEDKDEMLNILAAPGNTGVFHYKYMPRTGNGFTQADFSGITLTPSEWDVPKDLDTSGYPKEDIQMEMGRGKVKWNCPRWEDMPTQHHIVEILSKFEIKRYLGSLKRVSYSANDLYNQRILRDETSKVRGTTIFEEIF